LQNASDPLRQRRRARLGGERRRALTFVAPEPLHARRLEDEVLGIEHLGRKQRSSTADADVFAHFPREHVDGSVGLGIGDLQEFSVALAELAFRETEGAGPEDPRVPRRARSARHENAERGRVGPDGVTRVSDRERVEDDFARGNPEGQ
jgi:hypothetical protein